MVIVMLANNELITVKSAGVPELPDKKRPGI
jgi:hypothetical protein